MLRILLIVTLVTAAYGLPPNVSIDANRTTKIVGGYPIDIKTRPFMVAIIMNGKFRCGGSILSSTKVLTAAHCLLENKKANYEIRAGSTYRNKGGVVVNTTKFNIHPKYEQGIFEDFDVGVLHIEDNPLPLNEDTIKAVALPKFESTVPVGSNVITAGWGNLKQIKPHKKPSAEHLREVQVKTIATDKCQDMYENIFTITPRMICACVPEGGKDHCHGDSGGPLVTDDNVQIGIVAFALGCADPRYPGVYSNVAALRDWIEEVAGV